MNDCIVFVCELTELDSCLVTQNSEFVCFYVLLQTIIFSQLVKLTGLANDLKILIDWLIDNCQLQLLPKSSTFVVTLT